MDNKDRHLTPEQQKLAADNHNLIYSFAVKNKIDVVEYYDVLALGLCKAALYHDGVSGKFSTLAYKCMRTVYMDEVVTHDKRYKRGNGKRTEYYEDPVFQNGSKETYFNLFSNEKSPDEDSMILKLNFQEFCRYITDREQKVLKMKLSGMTQKEIAKEYGVTHQMVSLWLKSDQEESGIFL